MALRLTTPVAGAPAAAPVAGATALAARADALLRARNLAGYRALYADAHALTDPHDRYAAQRGLLHAGLAACSGSVAQTSGALAATAAEAVQLLEDTPAEPVLLNLAGVAFYELGAIAPAEALFAAAARLDADVPHLARNLAECKRRRRAGITAPSGLPVPVMELLRSAGPRAMHVAQAARPATGQTLGLCMIVRDEEQMLGRCLAAVRDAVDEIVVVDTGSTDRTVEIAESFGARILHHTWTGDFSAARNVSFDAATTDWILYLDADEVLVDGDAAALRALTGRTWREAFYLVETNHTGDLEDGTAVTHDALRVFRNRPQYRFTGRIHEQIAHTLPGHLPERLERSAVRVEHFGYLGEVRAAKDKATRNVELLERQAAEGVDTPFLHFNLGSEHLATGAHEKALEHLARGWQGVRDDPHLRTYGYVPSLASRWVKALRATGRHAEALRAGDEVLAQLEGFTDIVFEQGHAAFALGDLDRAATSFERCLELGDAPSRYSATVGCGTHFALVALADVRRAQGDLAAAEELLRRCLAEHPRFLGVVEPLATVLLARGVVPGEVVRTLHEGVEDLSPSARFLLAVPLYEQGAIAEAEAELRGVLAARPRVHQARVALAEALLSQDRLEEAAQEAAKVPAEAPCAAAAARTAAFAALAAGQQADLGQARASGLPEAELRAFEAWSAGGAADNAVPASAGPVVLTMLDALARLERFDAFEALAGAFEAVALPWRERRELLAGVYLRRGFEQSAADEWLEVCEREGPDTRALLGLAEVARRRGLDDDAQLLTAEAHALAGGAVAAA